MKSVKKATTAIILEERKPQQVNKYPVKLRVTYKRVRRYYTLKDLKDKSLIMTKEEFAKVQGTRPRDTYKEFSIHLSTIEKKAIKVIGNLPVFTFEAFERNFFSNNSDGRDLLSSLKNTATDLRKADRISYAVSYECASNSLKEYSGSTILPFENIDVHFLNEYEKWMQNSGNSLTTVGIYLRNIRTEFNKAIREEVVPASIYPFGQGKYEIPTGRNVKKAIFLKELRLIAKFKVIKGSSEHRYRDYWLFSYLCNGINVKDMARLKYGNINSDLITINRAKTERERKQAPKPIIIVITSMINRIINTWGNKPRLAEQYVFPILIPGLTATQEYKKIQQTTKMINDYIGHIAEELELSMKVTTYTARHSYATSLKHSGASMEFISESLGHSSMKTTENYMADFEIEEKRKWANKLSKL